MRSGSQFLDSLRVFERGQPSATKMACDFTKLGHSYRQASLSLATRYMHLHANVFLESKLALEQQQSVSLRQLCNGLSTAMVMPPNAQYSCLATRQLFTAAKVYKREVLRAVAEYEAKKASLLKESQVCVDRRHVLYCRRQFRCKCIGLRVRCLLQCPPPRL